MQVQSAFVHDASFQVIFRTRVVAAVIAASPFVLCGPPFFKNAGGNDFVRCVVDLVISPYMPRLEVVASRESIDRLRLCQEGASLIKLGERMTAQLLLRSR